MGERERGGGREEAERKEGERMSECVCGGVRVSKSGVFLITHTLTAFSNNAPNSFKITTRNSIQ